MPKLMELRDALITVIIRYHAKKVGSNTQTPEKTILEDLLTKPYEELNTALGTLIQEATAKDNTRLPLLNYILQGIKYFQVYSDAKPLTDEAAALLQQQLVPLISNLQTLLRSEEVSVPSEGEEHKLSSVVRPAFMAWTYTTAGGLINELVFVRLKLSINAPKDDIESTLAKMVAKEQGKYKLEQANAQIEILLSENAALQIEASKVAPLQNDNDALRAEVKKLKEQLEPKKSGADSEANDSAASQSGWPLSKHGNGKNRGRGLSSFFAQGQTPVAMTVGAPANAISQICKAATPARR